MTDNIPARDLIDASRTITDLTVSVPGFVECLLVPWPAGHGDQSPIEHINPEALNDPR